jgi:heterotetrameric sarcosine oxidase delta subunit
VSFLIGCPLCGPRDVVEYRYGGEVKARPAPGSAVADWSAYLFDRKNVAGVERAWWFHRSGCRRWFQAERDTRTNEVIRVGWTLTSPATGVEADG